MLGQVLVNGSMAFDIIMRYNGRFKDHILPDRLDAINLSFLTESARKEKGGCAGNIAYVMSLLGESPRIVATVGGDFEKYRAYLDNLGIDTSCIATYEDEFTATCTICADETNNQLTFVCVGAMSRGRELDLRDCATENTKFAIISPEDPIGMSKHCEEARQANIPFIYDPSFQVIAFSGEQLLKDVRQAKALIVNDYEFSLFLEKTNLTQEEITEIVEFVIVTRGEDGCTIYKANCEPLQIKAAKVDKVIDPTGAGDAFRGGLLHGLLHDKPLKVCAQIGSICGSYAVECMGTQNYKFSEEDFKARYRQTFGEEL